MAIFSLGTNDRHCQAGVPPCRLQKSFREQGLNLALGKSPFYDMLLANRPAKISPPRIRHDPSPTPRTALEVFSQPTGRILRTYSPIDPRMSKADSEICNSDYCTRRYRFLESFTALRSATNSRTAQTESKLPWTPGQAAMIIRVLDSILDRRCQAERAPHIHFTTLLPLFGISEHMREDAGITEWEH
jgi:hypothetical protein